MGFVVQICLLPSSHSRCSIASTSLSVVPRYSSALINHSALRHTDETFLGRPFNLFASCVEVEWRLRRRAVFTVPSMEDCCETNTGPS